MSDLQQAIHSLQNAAAGATAGNGGANGAAAGTEQEDEEVVDAQFTRE